MNFRIQKDYVLVISPRLVYLFGLFSGTPSLARAAAFFPFIFVRNEEIVQPWLINHELIHFRQQLETLFIGSILFDVLESLYACMVLGKTFSDAYKWRSSEQEAYRNQLNANYLHDRRLWTRFKYLTDKKMFTFGNPGEIIYS